MGFAILSGAGLLNKAKNAGNVHVHGTSYAEMVVTGTTGAIDLSAAFDGEETICADAPIFVMLTDGDGSLTGVALTGTVGDTATTINVTVESGTASGSVFVDYYVTKEATAVDELQIDASNFAGNYYVEASTLFRKQIDGVDAPVEITFPNVKIQSNFTFNMAATGDPSTFSFTMDAMPGYTEFNKSRKVLCAMQIIADNITNAQAFETVFPCEHTVSE